jgi:hypothetical protein
LKFQLGFKPCRRIRSVKIPGWFYTIAVKPKRLFLLALNPDELSHALILVTPDKSAHLKKDAGVNKEIQETSEHENLAILPGWPSQCQIRVRITSSQNKCAEPAQRQCEQECQEK